MPRERDEREVHGVEHQLDAHQHDEDVAARQDADHPQEEQRRGHREHREEADLFHHSSFLASTTAPTTATVRSAETTSKGSR